MVVQCPLCLGRYRVGDENKVPLEGVGVKCPGCGNIFTIYRMVADIQLIPLDTLTPEPPEEPKAEFEPEATPEPSVAAPEAEPSATPEEGAVFQPKPPVFEPEPPPQFAETATEVIPETEEAAMPTEEPTAAPEEALAAAPEIPTAAPEEALTASLEIPTAAPEIATAAPEEAPAAPSILEAEAELPPDVQKEHNKAKRLARVLVKDIVLYHTDRVEEGLEKGNLIDTVGDEIKKSWQYYKSEIPEGIVNSTDYFKDALNQILAKGRKIFT